MLVNELVTDLPDLTSAFVLDENRSQHWHARHSGNRRARFSKAKSPSRSDRLIYSHDQRAARHHVPLVLIVRFESENSDQMVALARSTRLVENLNVPPTGSCGSSPIGTNRCSIQFKKLTVRRDLLRHSHTHRGA